ncbi:MAG: patatin-like phospholipase family protein [Bacteroidia bacterium]|nr:patatin-like phospholipase family protein [Bacteroidia bacterium]
MKITGYQRLTFIVSLCFVCFTINAQKVGLVLSGGGAKGFAHIGVIRALEENGIPIDYIAGTSIGAIVGGLYSIGYTPDEMERLFKSEEFTLWAYGKLEDEQTYYFKKLEENASWMRLKFSDDSILKPELPTNLVSTSQVDLAFMQIFTSASAASHYHYDSLMLPFRCVATDVFRKKQFVMSSGDLSSSIRASMTFPLYFKPIKINDTLLFDGGMINNFPADIMIRDFNPDIIIGCKTASNSTPPDEDDIYSQLHSMLTSQTNYSVPKNKGIMIQPEFNKVGQFDFLRFNEIEEKGYKATLLKMDSIKMLVKRRISPEELGQKRIKFTRKKPELIFKDIHIDGMNSTQRDYVMKSIRKKSDVFTFDEFKNAYYKLLADEIIASIYPRAVYHPETGYFDLNLSIKREKRFEANLGGNISSSSINQAYAGVKYKYLTNQSYNIWANMYFGRFYSSACLRGRVDFPVLPFGSQKLNFPVYLDAGLTFNHWDYYKSNTDLFFEDSHPSYLVVDEANMRVDIGFPMKDHGRLTMGTAVAQSRDQYYQTNNFLKKDTADVTHFNLSTYHCTLETNTLNYRQFPNSGKLFSLSVRYIFGDENHIPGSTSPDRIQIQKEHQWLQADVTIDRYFKINRLFNLGVYFEGVASKQDFLSDYTTSIINASVFQPTPFSKTMFLYNFRAYNFAGGGLKQIFNIFKNFTLRMEEYVFQPYQKINEENMQPVYGKVLADRYYMESAVFVYQTLVGPASLSFSYYDKSDTKFYIQFNFGYILFNKKATD